ncbi:MAG: V-type ATP synthase subunit I, partial [Spirochaetales bacterium]|nr:V-type ATP synthase subunit I [Spirochaetales bacterium]
LDFLGNVPGYWETDVSPFFLIFFTIFFAMIIGDAGYGLLFILLTFVAQIKMKKFNNVLALFYLISSATVVWGAMTGSWFGSNMIKGIPFFNGFILSQLDTDKEIMELCFHIAVVHIVLARLTAFVKSMKDKLLSGFANLGWLSMTVGLLFLVKNLVISSTDYPVPTYSLIIVAFGFIVVLIFGKQEKGQSFLKGVGMSLAFSPLTALDTVGAFGDIISYVRLYAVGLAGFAVAQSFNGMAAPLISSGGFGYFGGALILLGGHVFNIAMAALSVLVHGVRLNVLEFSSAADVNWTGKKFNPFREI